MYVHFYCKPDAKSGLGLKVWNQLESILKEKEISYQVFFTKYQNHATKLVRQLTSDKKRHTIIAMGGDGTINEVINGICDLSKITFGYIPIGSSNDFARSLKLPTDAKEALHLILSPSQYTNINIGVLSYGEKKRRFAVSTGLGFDAAVCHQIVISRLKLLLNKIGLGKLSYATVALQRMIALDPQKMTLTLDDSHTLEFDKVYFATAMNLCYEGGGFKFCPKADCKDDKLDVIVISGISKLKALLLLPTAFMGWHVHFKGIHTYSCKKVEMHSERALPVHIDGEPIFLQRNVCMQLEPEKIRLIRNSD